MAKCVCGTCLRCKSRVRVNAWKASNRVKVNAWERRRRKRDVAHTRAVWKRQRDNRTPVQKRAQRRAMERHEASGKRLVAERARRRGVYLLYYSRLTAYPYEQEFPIFQMALESASRFRCFSLPT